MLKRNLFQIAPEHGCSDLEEFRRARLLEIINEALRAPVLLLRRLPDLARTPEERPRLEAFLNAVLNEMKMGAADGLKRSAFPKETSV